MTAKILIYDDYVHNNGILYRALCSYYGRTNVGYCDAQDIIEGGLCEETHLLVMPGGADLYYCEKLNGAGNKNIRNYVENGGRYLGICAGAYYACRAVEWGKDTTQEIVGSRELGFIDCLAVGPVNQFIKDGDINQSWNNFVTVTVCVDDEDTKYRVNYSGGPVFTNITDDANILGRFDFDDNNAAIIENKVKAGHVILTSTHPEMDTCNFQKALYKNNNSSFEYESNLIPDQRPDQFKKRSFLPFLLDRFNVRAA